METASKRTSLSGRRSDAWRTVNQGDRFLTLSAIPVTVVTYWDAPVSGGGEAVLPEGESFVVASDPPDSAPAVYVDPVRYDALHDRFVDEEVRKNPRYRGYHLLIDRSEIADHAVPKPGGGGGEVGNRVVVVGASANPERYGNQAVARLIGRGYTVVPVHPRAREVHGIPVVRRLDDIAGPVDTVTLYVSPAHSAELSDALVSLWPRRVIFNPGAENRDLRSRLEFAGIECLEACTLVLLATGQFGNGDLPVGITGGSG